ncbi:hypothetical protein [Zhihengliuella halotolerans]|uniref:hypothetical protein n=1 Tax=Zhihengliuella halotolerans TaxID=370736 RepID=UPI000C80ADA9|nr:hypothetical protein [Zhihengliuella halotolerans]
MTSTQRTRIVLCGLAALLNLTVVVFAWDFLGVFRSVMPPLLGILVVSLSLAALVATVKAARLQRDGVGLRRGILAIVCTASLLTVAGELLVFYSDDGNFAVALVPATGTILHGLTAVLLIAQGSSSRRPV